MLARNQSLRQRVLGLHELSEMKKRSIIDRREPQGVETKSRKYIDPMNAFTRIAALCLLLVAAIEPFACHSAEISSPVGVWKTFDDKTGNARAVVRIYEKDGKLFGRIEQSFTPGAESRVCAVCTDERKNQPMIGLIIIRNMKPEGSEYSGGDILDPESGSVYRCKMHLEQNGARLIVRGFVGFALLGRSQSWQRQS
jgi:uncharacterized protein (DUF2147 family)